MIRVKKHQGLFLLAQTPRAGRYNHRLIAPPNLEAAMINHVSAAPAQFGLVVRREVAQTSGRKGEEWLALVGVAVAQLSASQQAAIEKELTTILEIRFESWHKTQQWSGSNAIVRLEAMTDWLKDLQKKLGNFPTQVIDYEEKADSKNIPWLLAVPLLVIILAVAVFHFSSPQENQENAATSTVDAPTTPAKNPEDSSKAIEKRKSAQAALDERHKLVSKALDELKNLEALAADPEVAFNEASQTFENDLRAWSQSLKDGKPASDLDTIKNAMRQAYQRYQQGRSDENRLAQQQQTWLETLKNELNYDETVNFNDAASRTAAEDWLKSEQQKTAKPSAQEE